MRTRLRRLFGRLGGSASAVGEPPSPALVVPDDLIADIPLDLTGRWAVRACELPDSGPLPWLDRPTWRDELRARHARGDLDDVARDRCERFAVDGYVVIPGLFDQDRCDGVWEAYVRAAADGLIHPSDERKGDDDPHMGHVMNAHLEVPGILDMFIDPALLDIVSTLLGVEPVPFQTLLFPKSREQLEHSDTIHMTTYPLGYVCAAWIALEDVHPDSGPLCYYPGSHRLPRVFGHDVDLPPELFRERLYDAVAELYEPAIQRLIAERALDRRVFLPKKGDVLVWHDNLLHGATLRNDPQRSRRSLVGHYFGRGALCYHDLSGKIAERVHDADLRSVPARAVVAG